MNEENDVIRIEGKYLESPRANSLFQWDKISPCSEKIIRNAPRTSDGRLGCECSLCKLGLHIKHTDVLIINQFLTNRGKLIPRNVTGLCKTQHNRMKYLVVMAEKAGLIDVFNKNGTKRELQGWETLNKYYDEEVIEEFVYHKTRRSRA